jgi:hypothetical protein
MQPQLVTMIPTFLSYITFEQRAGSSHTWNTRTDSNGRTPGMGLPPPPPPPCVMQSCVFILSFDSNAKQSLEVQLCWTVLVSEWADGHVAPYSRHYEGCSIFQSRPTDGKNERPELLY